MRKSGEKWPVSWVSKFEMKFDAMTAKIPMSLTKAWIPYILVAIILVLTRVSTDAKAFVTSLVFSYKNISLKSHLLMVIKQIYYIKLHCF